ncbi:MAG: polyphosphate kinase 1 [Alphaproteobacteria bacterium]|nr:MAG: polyphosphate kinase 1 [Alphaproteobacteria bacterium]
MTVRTKDVVRSTSTLHAALDAQEQPAEAPAEVNVPQTDFSGPDFYLNRELTWLAFNRRVLSEAVDARTPLLERVKFLAIAGSNLDEFFMKRIGGLKQQVGAGLHDATVDGRTAQQQIDECTKVAVGLQNDMKKAYRTLLRDLKKYNIRISNYKDLSQEKQEELRQVFIDQIFPLVTPLAIDPAHPFPFLSNLSLNLLVSLKRTHTQEDVLARIKVPVGHGVPRFLRLSDSYEFVCLSSVIAHNLDLLFPDTEITSVERFRVIRNSNTERDEESADDLLAMIESELRDRKFAPIVRLEAEKTINPVHRGMLCAELGLDEESDVYQSNSLIGMRDLMEIAELGVPELHYPDHHPTMPVKLTDGRNIFHVIREAGSILLHHPYESFVSSVERLLFEAGRDPKVRAIKMTLYRTSSDSRIIDYLIEAARNGKQVAVVVELKARFDEAANIRWANRLEEAGIHVTYGVVGLKTHSKVILVVREDYNGLRRYAHIGTGNYHAGTARVYSDLGLLTSDPQIGADLSEFFNFLTTGCAPIRHYQTLLIAPKILKKQMIAKISREVERSTQTAPGLIRIKCNALEDPDITCALYEAAERGVKVELIIRDSCRLRPGIPGISDNISVVSIVGRFLEHARIFYFRNGGDEEYFIGSADLMRRNLDSRVEVLVPINDPEQQAELNAIFELQLSDRRSAWDMGPDGTYTQRRPGRKGRKTGSQQSLIKRAEKSTLDWKKRRQRKPKGIVS